MALALRFIKNNKSVKEILQAGARLKVIGDISRLSPEFQNTLNEYVEKTKDYSDIIVQVAISYSARDEIVRTVRKMQKKGIDFTIENISSNLDTAGVPDPDLIIRTSSKQRLSNFLLWQCSYSELYFSNLLWGDFNKTELQKAIDDYSKRARTYGK